MPSDAPALSEHLDTLYPLACVLAGPDTADTVVRHTFERAAATPVDARPEDTRSWLIQLLLDTHPNPQQSDGAPPAQGNRLTQEVATEAAARVLPAALAACSDTQRLILTLDVLDGAEETLARALHTTPDAIESRRADAWEALEEALLGSLVGPERALVADTFSASDLRALLREDVTSRFPAPPSSLRSVVRAILRQSEAEADGTSSDASPSDEATAEADSSERSLVWAGVLLLLVIGAAYGFFQLQSAPSAPSPPNLAALSVSAADTVRPSFETSDPATAGTYLRTTWRRRVAVPSVTDATFQGIGQLQVGTGARIPAFLYTDDRTTGQVTVFAFNYALLDELGERVQLEGDLRRALATNDDLISHTTDAGQAVVLWRQRDDILVAVAPHLDAKTLRDRLVPAGPSTG